MEKVLINPVLKNLESIMCLECNSSNWNYDKDLCCSKCGHKYIFLENGSILTTDDYIKESKWELLSNSINFDIFEGNTKPIKVDIIGGPRIKDLRKKLNILGLSINLGSGQDSYDGYINVDLGCYAPVHIVADLRKVPFKAESIELVVSNSVLEHIYDYEKVVKEVLRILKPGGFFYLCVPNACSMRHHTYDYHRWTTPGLRKLLESDFDVIDSGACRGPAYTLITFMEALIQYKIKNKFARKLCTRLLRVVSYPLFYLKNDKSENFQALSQTIYILGRKK